MLKVAICDDDEGYRKVIKDLVVQYNKQAIFFEYGKGEELIDDIDKNHNLVFLDIEMPGIGGSETAKTYRSKNKEAVLVFCTNHQNPPIECFKGQPFRYIIKDLQNKMLIYEMPDIINEVVVKW